jgi:membrane protease YdiL (CAAX protease family)
MAGSAIAPRGCEHQSLFREAQWLRRDALAGVCLSLVLLVGMHLARWDYFAGLSPVIVLAVYAAFYIGVLLLYPAWLARRRTPGFAFGWPQAGRLVKEFVLAVPTTGCLVALSALAAVAYRSLSNGDPFMPDSAAELADRMDARSAMVVAILAVFLAPVVEEVFFRGFLFNALRRVCPATVAACLQAALFGIAHAYRPPAMILATCLGLALAGVYQWRKTLLAPMFVHGLYNAVGAIAIAGSIAASAHAPVLGVRSARESGGQAVVGGVLPGSPAEMADLRPGDVILSYNNVPVTDFAQLRRLVRAGRVGDRVRIEVLRKGTRLQKQARLGPSRQTAGSPTLPSR